MIAALLAALAVSAGSGARGRTQELAGRLGLLDARERPRTGTLARLEWIERQYGFVVRQAVELFLVSAQIAVRYDTSSGGMAYDYNADWCAVLPAISGDMSPGAQYLRRARWRPPPGHMATQPGGFVVTGLGDPRCRLALPNPWVTTRFDALLPWVAALASRARRETDRDRLIELISDSGSFNGFVKYRGMLLVMDLMSDPAAVRAEMEQTLKLGPVDTTEPLRGPLRAPDERAWVIGWHIGKQEGLGEVRDFIDADAPADLLRLTWPELLARTRDWHRALSVVDGRGSPARPGIVVARWADGARLERLVTARQLSEEGESMGHCVGGYWPEVRDGSSVVLSYRDASGVPRATAEIEVARDAGTDRGLLLQLQGPENEPVSDPVVSGRMRAALSSLVANAPVPFVGLHLPDMAVTHVRGEPDADWGPYSHRTSPARYPPDYSATLRLRIELEELDMARRAARRGLAVTRRLRGDLSDADWAALPADLGQPAALTVPVGPGGWALACWQLGLEEGRFPSLDAYASHLAQQVRNWSEQCRVVCEGLIDEVNQQMSRESGGRDVVRRQRLRTRRVEIPTGMVYEVRGSDDEPAMAMMWVRPVAPGEIRTTIYEPPDGQAQSGEDEPPRVLAESDLNPLHALWLAGLLHPDSHVAEIRAARAAELAPDDWAGSIDEVRGLLSVPPNEHLRRAVRAGHVPDRDERRLLRDVPQRDLAGAR